MSKESRRRDYLARQKVKKENTRNFTKCEIDDLCNEKGYTVQHLTEYHVRINGVLDIYPTSRRYHLIRKNERDVLHNLEVDVPRLLTRA